MSSEYPSEVIDRLQLLWGEGFMSPGGPEEVRRIVTGLDLRDADVLDIGCGTGGPAVVLARDLGARVTGIDVEELVLVRAAAFARDAGVEHRLRFIRVQPGPLPLPDASFDVVFSKDALIHVADKASLYREILRVLRPGGVFVASDWLCSADAGKDPDFRAFVDGGMSFIMQTSEKTEETMRLAGFAEVESEDRNAWYAEFASRELELLNGDLRGRAVALLGQDGYDSWMTRRTQIARIAASGSLRPTDIRGRKTA